MNAPSPTPSPRLALRRYIAIFGLGVVTLLTLIAAANYALNPLIYSRQDMAAVAEALMAGKNVKVADSNIDWRGIRREHIARMQATPDVIVFGGSRWQEATGDSLPGYAMYTAFAQNDHLEDMMGLAQLLDQHGRLPRTLVLSVRFATFEQLDKRVAWWWKMLAPEYLEMGRRLGVRTRPWQEWLPTEKWLGLFSLDLLSAKARQYAAQGLHWAPTTQLADEQFDIVGTDGALRFSSQRLRQESGDNAQRSAIAKGRKDARTRLTIDQELVAQLPALLDFLRARGVKVVFAQTPFHPAYYQQIKGTPYHHDLARIEDELKTIALRAGLQVIGGFDAVEVGCKPSQFRDFNHGDSDCLKKILAQVRMDAPSPAAAALTPPER
jgi:hypothetical protein